ncbi:MAG TPA: hypothetical protein VJN18_28340 [Polyangiaceae bacterium]|nr:hypothetical protein [Polyangiaceae bacterium]
MSKAPPPLLGFNNNVRHRGRIFHIQTEDSGVKFPRIVTHLFADGGRIVKTTRTNYSEHVEKPNMATVVRGMMKEQHKAMFAALRTGDLDALLEQVCGPLEPPQDKLADTKDPTATSDLETARVVVGKHEAPAARPELPESAEMPVAAVAQKDAAPVVGAQAVIASMKALRDSEAAPRKRAISNPNLRRPTPSVAPPVGEAFDLDVASLDKNPPKAPRPPPPSARPPRKSNPASRKSRPPIPARHPPAAMPAPVAAAAASGSVGPAPASRPQPRPAGAPQPPPRSIFGDGAISEQSLDEVILSYLAEDLEESK